MLGSDILAASHFRDTLLNGFSFPVAEAGLGSLLQYFFLWFKIATFMLYDIKLVGPRSPICLWVRKNMKLLSEENLGHLPTEIVEVCIPVTVSVWGWPQPFTGGCQTRAQVGWWMARAGAFVLNQTPGPATIQMMISNFLLPGYF